MSTPETKNAAARIARIFKSDWRWAGYLALLTLIFSACQAPLQSRVDRLTKELAERKQEMELAKKSGTNLLSAVELRRMQERTDQFESGYILLSQTTEMLDQITDAAKQHNLRVIRIHSENPFPILDAAGSPVTIKGKPISCLPIQVRLEANYRNLGDFMRVLAQESKQMIQFEKVQIEPSGQDAANALRCDVTINYFSV